MKKMSMFLLMIFVIFSAYGAKAVEQTPLNIDNSAVFLDVEQDNTSLIDVDSMNKSQRVKQAQEDLQERRKKKPAKINLDQRQINHQRALNMMQRQNNAILPAF